MGKDFCEITMLPCPYLVSCEECALNTEYELARALGENEEEKQA